jgi:ketosteroid isomerase-like protein
MSSENEHLIERFYAAFARHDGAEMAACYGPDARFSDPVFVDLQGDQPGAMWEMLTGRAPDLKVTLVEHHANGERGTAHWLADYTFSATGRQVHNDVQAEFTFAGGLISEHRDSFDLYGWARQAIGPVGMLLGWTRPLQARLQRTARASLEEFMAARGQVAD